MSSLERLEPKRVPRRRCRVSRGESEHLLKIEYQIEAEIARPSEALSHAADRIAEGVGDERQGRGDAVVLERRACAVPVSEQVLLGQDELEGRVGQSACAGRRSRGVLGMDGGRPAEDYQERDGDAASIYGHVH